jgi:hypothetical protein
MVVWLYHWQTLAGAGLALIGAGLTIGQIRKQINQADRHERERIEREHLAHRATLPLALSGICDTLRRLVVELDRAKSVLSKSDRIADFSAPPPPSDHILELKNVISTTRDKSVIKPIAELIREIQTLWARVEVLYNKREQKRRAGLTDNVNGWIIQAATTYALAESLFPYAREESEHGPEAVKVEQAEALIFRHHIEDQALSKKITAMLEKSEFFWQLQ